MKVLVAEPIHDVPLTKLTQHVDVVRWDHPGAADWSNIDGVIVRAARVSREQIESAKKLKVIGKHGIGVNAIDVKAAREHGIRVVYTPTANVNSVAELVVALMMTQARKLPANMARIRAGATRIAPPDLTGLELTGKVLALVGLGRISQRVAAICKAGFGMSILGYDPYAAGDIGREWGLRRFDTIAELVRTADFVSVSVPYTPETHDLIAAPQLACFKRTAILVNTARGGVVNEEDLCRALRENRLFAAACDVFQHEPTPPDHPLLQLENFSGSLHVGAATEEALLRVGEEVVDDVLAVLAGREPAHPVDA